jgi:2-polyprenyl-3-methyl-5-hydroxy-6-metoxy-1,4-benzoquinol methylase
MELGFEARTACPACRAERATCLYTAQFTEPPLRTYLQATYACLDPAELDSLATGAYILDECQTCGLVYQRLIPNAALMVKLYEEWITPESSLAKRRSVGADFYIGLSQEITSLLRYFRKPPAELEFFDFGMGWGSWCLMAKAFGCSVAGTELSDARVAHANTLALEVIAWEEIAERRFDFINTEQVFEHLADPLGTLQVLARVLKLGGLIKLSVPNGWDIKRRLAKADWSAPRSSPDSLVAVAPLEHINCFAERSLTLMAQRAGLEKVELWRWDKALWRDATLREMARPAYNKIKPVLRPQQGSTYLFFQRSSFNHSFNLR